MILSVTVKNNLTVWVVALIHAVLLDRSCAVFPALKAF